MKRSLIILGIPAEYDSMPALRTMFGCLHIDGARQQFGFCISASVAVTESRSMCCPGDSRRLSCTAVESLQ